MKPLALLVEDRFEIADTWKKYLEPLDINSCHVTNLEDAFVILQKIPPPDIVLLDLNLGEYSAASYTVAQIAKIKSYNPDMLLIVISGVLTPDLIQVAVAQGANNIKEKIDMSQQVRLWQAIEESIEKASTTTKTVFGHPMKLLEALSRHSMLMI